MKKILVVDDDFEQRDLYLSVFAQNEFESVGAVDGQDALEKISKDHFDLVFTGIMMPRMDGFTLVENLRKNSSTASIPVVIFSHRGKDEDRTRAMQMGLEFMVKGYDAPKDILSKVKNLLDSGPGRTGVSGPPPPPTTDDRSGITTI